jgi:PQQ-dependent catabolism-associated beta-propeller protein
MPWSRRDFLMAALSSAALGACRNTKRERVYVSAEAAGVIGVIDPERGEVIERIHVGKRPRGIRLSHDQSLVYVALSGSPRAGPNVDESTLPPPDRSADGIGVVSLSQHKLLYTLPSGQDPECFDLDRDGRTIFISNEETAELSQLDLTSRKIIRKVTVGGEPEGVTLRPDGKIVYVTSEAENQVAAVDVNSLEVVARIPTGARPRAIAFSARGDTAFVSDELGSSITLIDAQRHTVAGTLELPSKGAPARPMGVALAPDGRRLYVSTGRGSTVAVIDVATRKLVTMIENVGVRPWGIGVSPDGKRLYTANGPSNDVSIIDLTTNRVARRLKLDGLPWGIAVGMV